jgi:hypothetical protein
MAAYYVKRWFVTPLGVALAAIITAFIIIFVIGETLLSLADPEAAQDSIERPELIFALVLAVLLLAVFAFIATRPAGSTGRLEQPVMIGHEPFLAPPPPPPDVALRNGPLGTIADIEEGYMLYARNGALARVLGKVPGSYEYGRRFSGYLYGAGVHGASDELWIPYEAVLAVYPETRSAFLAIKGDETEHFGWDRPPSSVSRRPGRPEGPRGL